MFGSQVINAAPGTVQQARNLTVGTGVEPLRDSFPEVEPGRFVAWCWTGKKDATTFSWVVQSGRKPIFVAPLGGPDAPAGDPVPGPPIIP